MSYIKSIREVPFYALASAAEFVRKKYNLDRGCIISDEFEKEFGIKIHTSDEDDVEFSSEGHYMMFLLRWS